MAGESLPGNARTILIGLLASAMMIAFCVLLGVALLMGAPNEHRALVIAGTPEIGSNDVECESEGDSISIAFQPESELSYVNSGGRAVMNRTCMISTDQNTGSGFIFTKNILVTANHVVDNSPDQVTLRCFTSGPRYPTKHIGTVVYRAPDYDVAFVRVGGSPVANAPMMRFSTSEPELLETLHMYGFEENREADAGSYIARHRPTSWFASGNLQQFEDLACPVLQVSLITGLANRGNSGGPVFNEQGQIVGMIIIVLENRNVTLMVPPFVLEDLLQLEGFLPFPSED